MSAMSDYLEVEIRKHIFRTGSFTKPTVLAIALGTASSDSSFTELANSGSYARQTLNPLDANWTAPDSTGGLTDNASDITFPTATGDWGSVSHVAIFDSASYGGGNMLFHGTLDTSKTVLTGDTFKFATGDLNITFA